MEAKQNPRERNWEDDHRISVGSEWSIWRHQHLGTSEVPIEGQDQGPPEEALPREGLPYPVDEPGRGFTSGRVTHVHVVGEV